MLILNLSIEGKIKTRKILTSDIPPRNNPLIVILELGQATKDESRLPKFGKDLVRYLCKFSLKILESYKGKYTEDIFHIYGHRRSNQINPESTSVDCVFLSTLEYTTPVHNL